MTVTVEVEVNGRPRTLDVGDDELLCDVLRERLHLTGTKVGCREGVCGSCDVLLDGEVIRSCLALGAHADGHRVVTVEGLSEGGVLSRLQKAFVERGAVQCGFCTSGMLIAVSAALARDPSLADSGGDVREVLSGNLCRCTGYSKIVDAVVEVARQAAT
jgi:aerobic-type carbon monoxide dehydrogenase small subunit (CoxS/CutS family)